MAIWKSKAYTTQFNTLSEGEGKFRFHLFLRYISNSFGYYF